MKKLSKWGRGNERGCEAALLYTMAAMKVFSSHELARKTGYSPQHVNRTLKKMWAFGKVAYRVVEHRKNSQKRLWVNVEFAEMSNFYNWERAMERLI